MSRQSRPNAFTLCEILVVLVVLALSFGILIPSLSTLVDHNRNRRATETICRSLAAARETACERSQPLLWKYDPNILPPGYLVNIYPAEPIEFKEDGTSSDYQLFIVNSSGLEVGSIEILGVTGSIRERT